MLTLSVLLALVLNVAFDHRGYLRKHCLRETGDDPKIREQPRSGKKKVYNGVPAESS